MKYFVVADVHGFYTELQIALQKAGFDPSNPEHIFVSCGDMFDRGKQAAELLEWVMSLDPARRVLVRGNHEDLMDEAIARGYFNQYDEPNGTESTAMQLTDVKHGPTACLAMKWHLLYDEYRNALVDYYETDHAVFVHGWIPCWVQKRRTFITYGENLTEFDQCYTAIPEWRECSREQWATARWANGMAAWAEGVRDPKKIFCGHWHTSWAWKHLRKQGEEFPNLYSTNPEHRIAHFEPFVDDGIVALDACTAYSKKVNCYVFDDTKSEE